MRSYSVSSDLVQVRAVQPIVYKQFDNGDTLKVELFQDGEKINLTTETVLAFFELLDGTVVQKNCTIEAGNAVVKLDSNILNHEGRVKVEFTIYDGENQTTTRTILITVEESIDRAGEIESVYQYDVIQQILDGYIYQQAVNAEEQATLAGQKAGLADQAATNANNAAANANSKATAAQTATDAANTAASNANSKATLANTAAGTANTSAANANTATTAANNAAASANTAKTNADTATANANAKATYATTQGDYAKAQGDYAKTEADRLFGTDVSTLDIRITNHLADPMPHLIKDLDNNKTYRYGLQVQNRVTQFIYEEVI